MIFPHPFNGQPNSQSPCHTPSLSLSSTALINGVWDSPYGAASSVKLGPMPLISIPLTWHNVPDNTRCFALTVVDYDTVPIIGFPWVHWIATNLSSQLNDLPANASQQHPHSMIQGINSFANGYAIALRELQGFQVPRQQAACYGGFVPVAFPHRYFVTLFALDQPLNLSHGFTYNQLIYGMRGHILSQGSLEGIYDAEIMHL